MRYQIIVKIIIGSVILYFSQSCSSSKNSNLRYELVPEKSYSSRLNLSKDYKQFVGKCGEVDIVIIDVDFKSSISYGQKISELGLILNPIKIPFHCRPILLLDTIAIITNPKLYYNECFYIVIINYKSEGIFNFSNGGDNVDLFLLKHDDRISISAALNMDKTLYEINNNPFSIIKKDSQKGDSGLYIYDYKSNIDKKTKIEERHKIRFFEKMKYRITDVTNCD